MDNLEDPGHGRGEALPGLCPSQPEAGDPEAAHHAGGRAAWPREAALATVSQ